ncbi:Pkc1p [Malassezia vespertilionis]|uniref:protein kinase C n=1 Tax=Malassezia vespertilionis TaxID=2020962 RepID=A0A2N1JCX8_9BASI|nr:Pkc1p [Malassezia vespertilionis]
MHVRMLSDTKLTLQDSPQAKIADVQVRIEKQHRMIEGFQTLQNATPNPDVIRQAESNIRNAQRTISYLQESLYSIQTRASVDLSNSTLDASMPSTVSSQASLVGKGLVVPAPGSLATADAAHHGQYGAQHPIDSSVAYRNGSTYYGGVLGEYSDSPVLQQGLNRDDTATRRNFSNLDLLKYDTPLTSAKISKALNQLNHKLELEKQYKHGFDKIAKLYQADGDRRSHADAVSRRAESASKMVLIQQALKRYKQLHIIDEPEDDADPSYINRRARKPQTGTLICKIMAVKDIDHAPVPTRSRSGRESYIALKIEDTERVQTQASRHDQWNEDFELRIDNGNEIELVIFDRVGSKQPVPVGLVWIRISDLIDQLRRKKFGQMQGSEATLSPGLNSRGGEWVTAERTQQSPNAPGGANGTFYDTPAGKPVPTTPLQAGVEGWFTVEPTGAVYLKLNFVKQNVQKRPFDARLGRQGALRKRRDDVSEINGHRFVPRQFYQMIRCALCGELILNGSGSQCEDCHYMCHRKCAQKVVIKCINKSNLESDRDEVKLNHRIPHRFETFTNLGTNWCCHCGYMLALGRKTNRKCQECDITCHADCAHLVPDFCGMSMEMANQLLTNIATINRDKLTGKPALQRKLGEVDVPISRTPPAMKGEAEQRQAASPDAAAQNLQKLEITPGAMPAGEAFTPNSVVPPKPLPLPHQGPIPTSNITSPVTPPGRVPVPTVGAPSALPAPKAVPPVARPPLADPVAPPITTSVANAASVDASPQKIVAQATAPPATTLQPLPSSSQHQVSLNDFNFLAVLGKGNFGKVMLAEDKHTGSLYAIKVLKKEFIIENDEIDSTRSEKRVFLTAARDRHPFLLGLHSCFQTETRVYFVMEYVSGGDLMLHIQREQFNLHRAKFYAAEVLLALEYFHKHGIIYRDLKLDNIMLTLDGHVKIADYGLCKEGMWYGNTTSTFCGTPEFMAPEILLEQRYGRAVDWWAFGILLYEMLLGQAPFRGDDEDEIFDAILEDEPLYPIQMPRESVSLLQRLLTRDPSKRLGAGPDDAEEVKAHPFFRDVRWDDLLQKRITPPFCPTLKNASDTTWFDTDFTNEKPTLTPVHSVFSPQDQAEFRDFSWTNPHVL